MVKPTQPMMARLRLTTKQVNGGYYKGNRTGSMGYFERNRRYVIDYSKVRTYVVPEGLADFKLSPFVTLRMEPTKSTFTKTVERPDGNIRTLQRAPGGKDFLDQWVMENPGEVQELKALDEEAA
ncbi:hypothetical protein FQN54_004014 [Arachnomyces sp. PD_36]|nr:hypothetical protein FQN54_004014 [Arachnomyces sp. PD_36]